MPTAGRKFLAFYIFDRAASATLSVYTNSSVCWWQNFFCCLFLALKGPSAYLSYVRRGLRPLIFLVGGALRALGGGLEFRLLEGGDPPLTPPNAHV